MPALPPSTATCRSFMLIADPPYFPNVSYGNHITERRVR
jgi:hypothetical protein